MRSPGNLSKLLTYVLLNAHHVSPNMLILFLDRSRPLPPVAPISNPASKITSEESASLRTKEKDAEANLLLQWFPEILPPFPFKNCHGWSESSELERGQEYASSPGCLLFYWHLTLHYCLLNKQSNLPFVTRKQNITYTKPKIFTEKIYFSSSVLSHSTHLFNIFIFVLHRWHINFYSWLFHWIFAATWPEERVRRINKTRMVET